MVRGDDWDWGDQDGGVGQQGKVLNIQDWENESARSVACIQWLCNRTKNVYRVGHKVRFLFVRENIFTTLCSSSFNLVRAYFASTPKSFPSLSFEDFSGRLAETKMEDGSLRKPTPILHEGQMSAWQTSA